MQKKRTIDLPYLLLQLQMGGFCVFSAKKQGSKPISIKFSYFVHYAEKKPKTLEKSALEALSQPAGMGKLEKICDKNTKKVLDFPERVMYNRAIRNRFRKHDCQESRPNATCITISGQE